MEAKLSASQVPAVLDLLRLYRALAAGFEQDLASRARDLNLANASALMLVQAVAQVEEARSPFAQAPGSTGPAGGLRSVEQQPWQCSSTIS